MTAVAFSNADHSLGAASGLSDGGKSIPSTGGRHSLSYLAHFGLAEAPFGLTPDTDFFFASPPHQEALDTLLYALENGEGFIKIVGAVGTGKTLLCRTLLAELPRRCRALYLPNPALDPVGILCAVAEELGIKLTGQESYYRVHKAIQSRLIALARRGTRVVLILDEAQAISLESLETIRLLSNLETEKRKLLAIVLFGQPELDARLQAIPQLKTRISFHDRLRPLEREELVAYLSHRMARAGFESAVLPFNPRAVGLLYEASAGVPRVANVIAHKALMLAYGKGLHRVGGREMREAVRDTLAAKAVNRTARWMLFVLAALGASAAAAGWLYLIA
ncbi:MAG: AAA family ATPase [Betaproteobacteria bacterium]|nr:AAA family ATPase [Betaproteobacteria bacterium]